MSIFIQGARVTSNGEGKRLNVLGDHQRVILASEDTDGRYALIENCNLPGVGIPLHLHHNEDETFHVLEGQVEFQIGSETIQAIAGTTIYLPRDTPHAFTIVGEAPAKMLIMLTPAGLEKYFEELSQLSSDKPPNMETVMDISAQYGIELFPYPGSSAI
jgi:quercetin dioxygenase-like cupin family protein